MKHALKLALGITLIVLNAVAASPVAANSRDTDSGIGERRKVDAPARRVIIRHGDWVGGNMSAMTMAMQVRPGVGLDSLQRGDRVRFEVARQGADWVLTKMEPLPH